MGWWDEDAPRHEGWIASMLPDRRASNGSTAGHVLIDDERVPEQQVVGFQPRCGCGWTGAYWTRVRDRQHEDQTLRRIYTEDGFDATPEAERSMHDEWRRHIQPFAITAGVADAARSYQAARLALDAAVRQARADGASWGDIGAAAGISRQSAHERWAQLER